MDTDIRIQEAKNRPEFVLYRQLKTEEEKLKEFKRNIVSKKFTYKGTLSELTKTIAERRAEYLKSQKIVNKESRDNAINLMVGYLKFLYLDILRQLPYHGQCMAYVCLFCLIGLSL